MLNYVASIIGLLLVILCTFIMVYFLLFTNFVENTLQKHLINKFKKTK
jgi:hypothetical protein